MRNVHASWLHHVRACTALRAGTVQMSGRYVLPVMLDPEPIQLQAAHNVLRARTTYQAMQMWTRPVSSTLNLRWAMTFVIRVRRDISRRALNQFYAPKQTPLMLHQWPSGRTSVPANRVCILGTVRTLPETVHGTLALALAMWRRVTRAATRIHVATVAQLECTIGRVTLNARVVPLALLPRLLLVAVPLALMPQRALNAVLASTQQVPLPIARRVLPEHTRQLAGLTPQRHAGHAQQGLWQRSALILV